jgi:hypothetical protein
MAVRMRLFGVEDALEPRDLEDLSEDQQSNLSHAAWGGFNIVA